MPWRRDPVEFAKRFEAANFNVSEMARMNGADGPSLGRWRQTHGIEYPAGINKHDRMRHREQPPLIPILDEQLRLEGDYAIASDWHAPLTRYDVLHRFLDDSQRAGLTRCIIPGDLTNQDALAGHEEQQSEAGLEVEMEHLAYSVDTALDVFDTIIVTLGNHDRHAAIKTKVSFERSIRMLLGDLGPEKLARIKITARDNVIVDTDRGEWLVCHTRSYSRMPLAYPNKLALRHNQHIAGGHRHHHALGVAANGKTIVELGGLMDEERMAYANRYTNDMPKMANGFMLLVDGRAVCPMLG